MEGGWGYEQKLISELIQGANFAETGLEGPHDDGFSWRKYGQKDILGAKYPRSYYRCTYRNTQNCWATKQVQRSDDDPTVFEITYRGKHMCVHGGPSTPLPASPEKQDAKQINHQQDPTQQDALARFRAALRVETEDFLQLYKTDPTTLRNILGSGLPNKTWKVITDHAITCAMDDNDSYTFQEAPPTSELPISSHCEDIHEDLKQQAVDLKNLEDAAAKCLQGTMEKGPWTAEEDQKLVNYIHKEGTVSWNLIPKLAGLNRSGKSCRLRWLNHLSPRRCRSSEHEKQAIIGLHSTLRGSWTKIAEHLPGRTDTEIKYFRDTNLRNRLHQATEKNQMMQKLALSERGATSTSIVSDAADGQDSEITELKMKTDSIDDDQNQMYLAEEEFHEETESCHSDSDIEDARGGKHQKLLVPDKSHEDIKIPEIHMQSCADTVLEECCLPVDMSLEDSIPHAATSDMMSWELFHQNVGEAVHSTEIKTIAKEIVKVCERDFRSLILMARALSNVRDIETWEDARDSLSVQHPSCHDDSRNLLVNVLKFSIELLDDDVARKCLMSLALHIKSREVPRASLIDSWIRDGLLAMHSEGETVIQNLVDAKLLELTENGELVKFLDLDQHLVDLIFQHEEGREFLMQGGLGLVKPPDVGEWERAKEVYLMQNDLSELPENPKCPSLSALFLQRNQKLRVIPCSFFTHMPALKVLNLSRTRIKSLPDSLFELINLERLFLNECLLLRALPAKIGGLENLEVLDIEGTKLVELPKETQQLINLTCLEVSILGGGFKHDKQIHSLFPYGVVSALLLLEELNIDVGPDAEWWDSCVEGLLEEIRCLERLTSLKFYIPKVELLRQFDATSLTHFRLVVGKYVGRIMSRLHADVDFELGRWDRYLKYVHGKGVVEDVMKVLKQADALFLDRHTDLKRLSDFGKENLEQLRCCVLGECNEMQVLIDAAHSREEGGVFLESLEYLYVYYMKNLQTIWRGPVQKQSLSCLKFLTLRTCPNVTSIFTVELLQNLSNLEELSVEDCPALVRLISCEHPIHLKTPYYLPMLRKLSLHYLPQLTSICSGLRVAPRIEWLSFYDCPNVKSLDLPVEEVKRIRGQIIWWEGLGWTGDRPGKLDNLFVAIGADAIP